MSRLTQLSKKGWQFVALTLSLSAVPYFFIIQEENSDSNWALLLMWTPGIAGIILRLAHKEGLFKGLVWNPFKDWRWIFLAAFIPFTIEILSMATTVALHAAQLKQGFLSIENGQVAMKGIAMLFGASAQPWYLFLPNFVLSFFVGTLFYSLVFAIGEELGWRGFLQRHWAPNNRWFPLFIIGAIWGWWHLPGILLGHNYPDYPILGGFVLMPIVTILFSIAFGVAFNKRKVIWVPAVFHGALNISADISNIGLLEDSLHRPTHDLIWSGLWLLTAVLIWKINGKTYSES